MSNNSLQFFTYTPLLHNRLEVWLSPGLASGTGLLSIFVRFSVVGAACRQGLRTYLCSASIQSAHANFHSALQSQNNTSNMHPATCLPAPADFDSRPLFSRRRLSGPASATPCRMGSQMKATAMYVPALQALVVLRLVALVFHSTCGLRHKLHHKK